jgi:hypothetical protein
VLNKPEPSATSVLRDEAVMLCSSSLTGFAFSVAVSPAHRQALTWTGGVPGPSRAASGSAPDGGGCPRTVCPDLRICECRCGAPGWRTARLGVGDPM